MHRQQTHGIVVDMQDKQHLDHPSIAFVFSLWGPFALGAGMMVANSQFWLGVLICGFSIFGTYYRFSEEVKNYKKLLKEKNKNFIIVTLTMAFQFVIIVSIISSHYYDDSQLSRKEEMARRWVVLSDDILRDVSSIHSDFTIPPFDLPKDVQQRMFQEESRKSIDRSNEQLAGMRQKYSSKTVQALDEIKSMNLLDLSDRRIDSFDINMLGWQYVAKIIGADGRKLLFDIGKS